MNNKYSIGLILVASFLLITTSCERTLSDEATLPKFASVGAVFTDDFIGMGADFYFPFADAKPDVFSVDDEGYESFSSVRIDVPNITDPTGNYAGAIFRVEGAGRNLTAFDALTFYIKASQGVDLGDVGYGIDYEQDKYRVGLNNVNVGTNWTKVIIPIPDASKLLQERGMFWFAAGTQGTNGVGYSLWFDEIKFEKLGTISAPVGQIEEGKTRSVQGFVGSDININGVSQVYSLTNGQTVTTSCAPAYYDYVSSDTTVAQINEGVITVVGSGSAEITASLLGQPAKGRILVESLGSLPASPTPTHPASNVKSIFSDAYPSVTTSNYTPGFGGSTSETTVISAGGGNMLQYRNNNFTGIMFNNTVNASDLGYLHIDAFVPTNSTSIGIQIRDVGGNKMIETNIFTGFPEGDDKDFRRTLNGFTAGVWKSFDIPLGGNIANQKNNLGAIIITDGPEFIFDNIYFYKQ